MSQKLLLRTLLLSCILLGTVVAVAAPATNASTGSAVAVHTYLQPDLSLKSVLVSDSFQIAGKAATGTSIRTCRCSCGQPCTSNADCGGNVCGVGITCCGRNPQDSPWLNLSSSHKTSAPAVALKCN